MCFWQFLWLEVYFTRTIEQVAFIFCYFNTRKEYSIPSEQSIPIGKDIRYFSLSRPNARLIWRPTSLARFINIKSIIWNIYKNSIFAHTKIWNSLIARISFNCGSFVVFQYHHKYCLFDGIIYPHKIQLKFIKFRRLC